MKKSTNINPTTITKSNNAKTLYVIFAVVVVGLIFLIGWFAYLLLWQPDDKETNGITDSTENTDITAKKTTKKNKNSNKNSNTANENSENDNTNNTNDDEGLVEPDENDNDNANDNTNSEDGDDEDSEAEGDIKTLYFASSSSSCGETVAVERPLTLSDDPYGEIILSMMSGPADDEDGADGIPSTVRLRQVQYTADGPLITVGEGYNELSDCEKQTVDAQFIETANAMFDLPAGTDGEVVVGEVVTDDAEDTAGDTNSNTNTEE